MSVARGTNQALLISSIDLVIDAHRYGANSLDQPRLFEDPRSECSA
jgi:hypothetical protein